jgi:hypothetical protein
VAREVIVRTWCDPCLAEDRQEDGVELAPLLLPELGGTKARVVALCEVHRKELYQPLLDLLEEHGQMVDEEGNPSGPRGAYKKRALASPEALSCPAEGCDHISPNRSALSSHVRNMHGTTLSALNGEPTPYECPECGLKSARPQGIAAHRRKVHGVIGTSATAVAVREAKGQDQDQGELALSEPSPEAEAPTPKKRATRARKKAPASS